MKDLREVRKQVYMLSFSLFILYSVASAVGSNSPSIYTFYNLAFHVCITLFAFGLLLQADQSWWSLHKKYGIWFCFNLLTSLLS